MITKQLQKASVNAIAEALVSRLVYNSKSNLYELPSENLFTISKPIVEYAAKELGIELKQSNLGSSSQLNQELQDCFLRVLQTSDVKKENIVPTLQETSEELFSPKPPVSPIKP
ncbi:MAG: hypothetical protein LC122_05275 [Chitinophagales bacterium]|nr:hypothetical protein [Chitinophagales bacterium]